MHLEKACHGLGIVGSLGLVLLEEHRVRDFIRQAIQLRRAAERTNKVEDARMEVGDRHGVEGKAGSASIGGHSDHRMVDQVENELDPARSIRNEPGRQASSIR